MSTSSTSSTSSSTSSSAAHEARHVPVPSGRALLTGTAALAAWFVVMNAGSGIIASIAGFHGNTGMLFALSMSPGYGPAGAHGILTALGPHGRAADAVSLAIFDVAFPLLYGWVLSAALRKLAAHWRISARMRTRMGWFPLAAVVANWLADACIFTLIAAFPATPGPVAVAASALTAIKLAVILTSVAAVAVGCAAVAVTRVRRKAGRQTVRAA